MPGTDGGLDQDLEAELAKLVPSRHAFRSSRVRDGQAAVCFEEGRIWSGRAVLLAVGFARVVGASRVDLTVAHGVVDR